jgi:hypothetical protein
MDGIADGVTAREQEAAAIRLRLVEWADRPGWTPSGTAVGYTFDQVKEFGRKRIRAASTYLSGSDLGGRRPLLVDPDDPHVAQILGVVSVLPGIETALLHEEILAAMATRHTQRVLRLAVEWLDCAAHGLIVIVSRESTARLGFRTAAEMGTALRVVRLLAPEVAARYVGRAGVARLLRPGSPMAVTQRSRPARDRHVADLNTALRLAHRR